jgi:hypothetical protein
MAAMAVAAQVADQRDLLRRDRDASLACDPQRPLAPADPPRGAVALDFDEAVPTEPGEGCLDARQVAESTVRLVKTKKPAVCDGEGETTKRTATSRAR